MIRRLFRRRQEPPAAPTVPHVQDAASLCEPELRERERTPASPAAVFHTPGPVESFDPLERGVRLQCAEAALALTWLAPDCLRVQREDSPAPDLLPPLNTAETPLAFSLLEDPLSMTTPAAVCHIDREGGRFQLTLADGTPALTLRDGLSWRADGGAARLSLALPPDARCYGLGARSGALNVRGEEIALWNDGAHGMIAAVPVVLIVRPQVSCALFWRDAARARVSLGAGRADELLIQSESGRIDCIACAAPTAVAALARFIQLQQPNALPPTWALGYQYGGDGVLSADHALALAREFRARQMPCDALHLGGAYMAGGRTLQVDAVRFPALRDLIDTLHADGFQVVMDAHPAVAVDEANPLYASGRAQGAFMNYADGRPVRAAALPGASVFPDLSRPQVRDWWAGQVTGLARLGFDGAVARAGEPRIQRPRGAAALPDAALHQTDHGPQPHSALHNLYGHWLAEANGAGLRRHQPALRTFNALTSGWTGSGAAGMCWIEPQAEGWAGLRAALQASLNAALSGLPLTGVDVGAGDGELMCRWLQAACLLPGVRGWAANDAPSTPWAFGQPYELVNRLTLQLRQRLAGYLYSSMALAREYGTPVITPLELLQPEARGAAFAYLVGGHLLVAPVVTPGTIERIVPLPPGLWYDFWTNEPIEGGREVSVPAPLERLPLFVRGGTVLSFPEPMEYANQRTPESFTLRVFPGSTETTYYEDHGEGQAYTHGEYRWVYYTCAWENEAAFVITRRKAGVYSPPHLRVYVEVVGLREEPDEVRLERQHAPLWYFDDGVVELATDDEFGRIEVWMPGGSQTPTRRRRGI